MFSLLPFYVELKLFSAEQLNQFCDASHVVIVVFRYEEGMVNDAHKLVQSRMNGRALYELVVVSVQTTHELGALCAECT